MNQETNDRYSDADLEEFKQLIQEKIENATKILYSNNMVEIFLVNKGENFSNFFFETGNRFLREYKKLSF